MDIIYADLPSYVQAVLIEADVIVVSSALRAIVERRTPSWTPARWRIALGLDLDDVAYPGPPETQSEVGTRLSRRRAAQLGAD